MFGSSLQVFNHLVDSSCRCPPLVHSKYKPGWLRAEWIEHAIPRFHNSTMEFFMDDKSDSVLYMYYKYWHHTILRKKQHHHSCRECQLMLMTKKILKYYDIYACGPQFFPGMMCYMHMYLLCCANTPAEQNIQWWVFLIDKLYFNWTFVG